MYYKRYKKKDPDGVLVQIEYYNKDENSIIFDFLDPKEFNQFLAYFDNNIDKTGPSMIQLENYNLNEVQENTIYEIKKEVIGAWFEQGFFNQNQDINSFLILFTIKLEGYQENVFSDNIWIDNSSDTITNFFALGQGNISQLNLNREGLISVNVRNVGQGNWNEILIGDKVVVVFDAGASMHASRTDVRNIIANRPEQYLIDKPGLILSHWDMDHYHSLIGMTDAELLAFSYFICRDFLPNNTSRNLFNRIESLIGGANIYTIPADVRPAGRRPVYLTLRQNISGNISLYNAQKHKNRNISGIVLLVKTDTSSIILPGDCHYDQISRDILPSLNYIHTHNLIVPHHCGNAGPFCYVLPAGVTPSIAAISVGSNSYGHPIRHYYRSLRMEYFNVLQTQINNDIIINL